MTQVIAVIGAGSIGQAIARRVSAGKHVLLADLRQENVDAAAKVLGDAGFEVSAAIVDVSSRQSVHALAASVGLAAVFAVSSLAFSVIKFAGALYLVYLGVKMLRSSSGENPAPTPATASLGRVFRDGFVVALLNPKTTVFFAAFLPQFLSPIAPPMVQGVALGSLFVAIAAVTDSAYAMAAGAITPALRGIGMRRMGRRLAGGVFIGLGVFAAVAGTRGAK